jgi:RimJ/RimL family protein N-acetyltransferase
VLRIGCEWPEGGTIQTDSVLLLVVGMNHRAGARSARGTRLRGTRLSISNTPVGITRPDTHTGLSKEHDMHTNSNSSMSTTRELTTERLTLRPWCIDDAQAALDVYGHAEVTRWLSPEMDRVPDLAAMRLLLQQWIAEDSRLPAPAGRWTIQRNTDAQVIGGALLLPLPPGHEDLEIAWQLHPDTWGNGYASETTHALATWAFSQDIDEIFAVVRAENARAAATVRHNGMHWVGETSKYFGTNLQVFRLRMADLDREAPEGNHPPNLAH